MVSANAVFSLVGSELVLQVVCCLIYKDFVMSQDVKHLFLVQVISSGKAFASLQYSLISAKKKLNSGAIFYNRAIMTR